MAYREFRDPAGVLWRVWDTYPHSSSSVRARFVSGWLSFQSDTERRRLRPVPEAWSESTDDELYEWLEQAEAMSTVEISMPRRASEGRARQADEPAQGEAAEEKAGGQSPLAERTSSVVRQAREVIRSIGDLFGRD